MIGIDFEIDEHELAENLEDDITKDDHVLFLLTIFIMPVKININGTELLEHNNSFWVGMPIMNIASEGLLTVKKLKKDRKKIYILPEGAGIIEFTLINSDDVRFFYTGFAKPLDIIVKYSELFEAFQKFTAKVRKFLWERVPQMSDHPYWRPWLCGERD